MRSLIRLLILAWLAVVMLGVILPTVIAGLVVIPAALVRGAAALLQTPLRMVGMAGGHHAISFMPMLVLLLLVGAAFLLAMRALRSRGGRRSGYEPESAADEAHMMREIHRSLTRMEDRVEALETILLDSEVRLSSARDNDRRAHYETERNGL